MTDTLFRAAALAFVALAVGGCAIKFPVAGKFESQDEVFIGTVSHNLLTGTGQVFARAEVAQVSCDGTAVSDPYSVQGLGCAGAVGVANLTCTDGRRITANYTCTSCSTGYGRGTDSNGKAFTFAFGQSQEEAERIVEETLTKFGGR